MEDTKDLFKHIAVSVALPELFYNFRVFNRKSNEEIFPLVSKYEEKYFINGWKIDNWQFDINKYAIDILYSYNQNKFKLRFFYRETGNYTNDLITVLSKHGFSALNESYVLYLEETEVLKTINDLGASLKGLPL